MKPTFRRAFIGRRCLILADGFYEWQKQEQHKQPFYIHLQDGKPFAFAGLWERWAPEEGQPLDSCTIITTTANDLIRPLHVRMPVILPMADHDAWLDPGGQDMDRLQALLHPYPSEAMEAYPVSPRVNNATFDSPECTQPLA